MKRGEKVIQIAATGKDIVMLTNKGNVYVRVFEDGRLVKLDPPKCDPKEDY